MKTLFLFLFATLFVAMPAWAGANRPQTAPVAPAAAASEAQPAPKAPQKGVRQWVQKHSPMQRFKTMIEGKLKIAVMCAIAALVLSLAGTVLSLGVLLSVSYVLWIIAVIFLILWFFDYL